jgi:hypothetical protein
MDPLTKIELVSVRSVVTREFSFGDRRFSFTEYPPISVDYRSARSSQYGYAAMLRPIYVNIRGDDSKVRDFFKRFPPVGGNAKKPTLLEVAVVAFVGAVEISFAERVISLIDPQNPWQNADVAAGCAFVASAELALYDREIVVAGSRDQRGDSLVFSRDDESGCLSLRDAYLSDSGARAEAFLVARRPKPQP